MTPGAADMNRPPAELRASPTSSTATGAVPRRGAWLTFLCLNLLGYALLGKGWAHVGLYPIFVGEMILTRIAGMLAIGRTTPDKAANLMHAGVLSAAVFDHGSAAFGGDGSARLGDDGRVTPSFEPMRFA